MQSFQSKLEALLSVFDQTKQSTEAYILSFPDKLPSLRIVQKIIQRLQRAGASEELRKQAEIEDEIETSFKTMARQIQEKDQAIQAIQEKNQAI